MAHHRLPAQSRALNLIKIIFYFVFGIHALTELAGALDVAAFNASRPIPETVPADNLLEHSWPIDTKSARDVHGRRQ